MNTLITPHSTTINLAIYRGNTYTKAHTHVPFQTNNQMLAFPKAWQIGMGYTY